MKQLYWISCLCVLLLATLVLVALTVPPQSPVAHHSSSTAGISTPQELSFKEKFALIEAGKTVTPVTPEPSASHQALWKQERAAAQEREQEHQAAASALVTHCRRHIQGQYVSPEEMRAFTRCIDGR